MIRRDGRGISGRIQTFGVTQLSLSITGGAHFARVDKANTRRRSLCSQQLGSEQKGRPSDHCAPSQFAAIEKDVDAMICLHRNRIGVIKASEFQGYVEEKENFGPYVLARVDLSRYSSGGSTTLFMEGSMSYVREMKPDEASSFAGTVPAISSEVPVEGMPNNAEGF